MTLSSPCQHYSAIQDALTAQRFETARRMAVSAYDMGNPSGDAQTELATLLHESLSMLGDLAGAIQAIETCDDHKQSLPLMLKLARAYYLYTSEHHYRESPEQAAGLCYDEYMDKYNALADSTFEKALPLITTDDERCLASQALKTCKRYEQSKQVLGDAKRNTPSLKNIITPHESGSITGTITDDKGNALTDTTIVLGVYKDPNNLWQPSDPADFFGHGMHYEKQTPDIITRNTTTDSNGSYQFEDVPAGTIPFLAIKQDETAAAIHTQFFAQYLVVNPNETLTCDGSTRAWRSAAPEASHTTLPDTLTHDGKIYTRINNSFIHNPFVYDFPRQHLCIAIEDEKTLQDQQCLVISANDISTPLTHQINREGVHILIGCEKKSQQHIGVYTTPAAPTEIPLTAPSKHWVMPIDQQTAILNTGTVKFKIPLGSANDIGSTIPAPIQGISGHDGLWRGEGRWTLPTTEAISSWRASVIEAGPVLCRIDIIYTFESGCEHTWHLEAHRDEDYLLVHEVTTDKQGVNVQLHFPCFQNGRHYLHWNSENGSVHWKDVEAKDKELARLQESVAWWIPPQGFGSAFTHNSLDSQDYVAVFTRRRGEWIDRKFAAIAQGPGDDHRELDWPYPEMVGSTISMITTHTTKAGEVYYQFNAFDGERKWGLLVSTMDKNDGTHKHISEVQHKTSSPRLQEFQHWQLDARDGIERPSLMATHETLPALKAKRHDARHQELWQRVKDHPERGPGKGLVALIEGDPALLWQLKHELVVEAPIRSRMTLLGREYSDMYSPVGGRPITPWAETYDLIAGTGVFTPEEERSVRAFLMLMGHMFMSEDLMNWRHNSRNANFEADRVDVVGTVGLTFPHLADSQAMIQHGVDLMQRSLEIYCTPGSGKWYENPACYYIHASSCRLNFVWHLYHNKIHDCTEIERLKDYLSWGPNILTPRFPHDATTLIKGCDDTTYRECQVNDAARRIPPIGDHAQLGQWVSEYYALMSKAYRKSDPEFANYLQWAYDEGGRWGGHFNKYPAYFAAIDESDLPKASPVELTSRRLEGFGAIFRDRFGQDKEDYILFKLGPGGYRYHRTEGSIIMFADGKPIIYDGGEAGETWRHTTLSFGDTHMPLAPGHIERNINADGVDFAQGVNPKALDPGEPVFLSDTCEHHLVEEAFKRYNEPHPANSRTCLWVKQDYLILHDELDLPDGLTTHWHLQAVADDHTALAPTNVIFKGRYGLDFQVTLPDQHFDASTFTQTPIVSYKHAPEDCFSMRHWQLTASSPTSIAAIIRPIPDGAHPITSHYDNQMLQVTGATINDLHFLNRLGQRWSHGDVLFEGKYASVISRGNETRLCMYDGNTLSTPALTIESSELSVCVSVTDDALTVQAFGTGSATLTTATKSHHIQCNDTLTTTLLP